MKKLISALLFSVMIVSTVSPTYAAKFKPTGTYYISRNDSYIDVFKYQGQLAFTPHPKVGDYSYEFRYDTLTKISSKTYRADDLKYKLKWINNNCMKVSGKDAKTGMGSGYAGTFYRVPAAPKLKSISTYTAPGEGDAVAVSMNWNKMPRASGYQIRIGEKDPDGWYSYSQSSKKPSKSFEVGTSVMQIRVKIRSYHMLKGNYKLYGPWSKTTYKTIYTS